MHIVLLPIVILCKEDVNSMILIFDGAVYIRRWLHCVRSELALYSYNGSGSTDDHNNR